MAEYDNDFKRIVERLDVNDKPDSVHQEKLRKEMMSAFNASQQRGVFSFKLQGPFRMIGVAAVLIIGVFIAITVIMPFGHKDQGQGQRFMVSYDEGQSWSKTVFELNKSGMYASSVVLDDQTIVTVHAIESHQGGQNALEVLRWKAPPRDVVSKNGFFTPKPVTSES